MSPLVNVVVARLEHQVLRLGIPAALLGSMTVEPRVRFLQGPRLIRNQLRNVKLRRLVRVDLTQLHHVQARSTPSDPRKAHGRLASPGVARIGCAEEPSVLLLLVHAEVGSFKALGWSRCDCQALSQLQGVRWRTLT